MSEYDNTNTGVLFINDKKGNDKAPDRKGSINVNGVEFWISGWVKTAVRDSKAMKTGDKFMSLQIQPKEARSEARSGPLETPAPKRFPIDDNIDF